MSDVFRLEEANSFIDALRPLVTSGQFGEAARRTALLRDSMLAEHATEAAACLTSFLGTIALAERAGFEPSGFDAANESKRAEDLSSDPAYRLLSAHRMLVMGDIDGAEAKLREFEALTQSSRQSVITLKGQIALRRGDQSTACELIAELLRVSSDENRHAIQWDLALVEDATKRGACKETCRRFVDHVLALAAERPAPPVERRCRKILEQLSDTNR